MKTLRKFRIFPKDVFFGILWISNVWGKVTDVENVWQIGNILTDCCWRFNYKENRIYIRGEFSKKKCKTAILLYCFHTVGVLLIFMLYNRLGPGISFYRKSKIIVKRKPNYEVGWFHNWPMIIFHIDSMPSTLQTMIFRYNYKSNDVFYSPNSL